jgi:hypothetical protein
VPIGMPGAQCQCKQQEECWLRHHFEHCIHADFQVHGHFAGSNGESSNKQRHARGGLGDEGERGVEQGQHAHANEHQGDGNQDNPEAERSP